MKRKLKNFVLKSISYFFAFVLIFCICCIDSQNAIPFYIGIGISSLWLIPMGIINGVIWLWLILYTVLKILLF